MLHQFGGQFVAVPEAVTEDRVHSQARSGRPCGSFPHQFGLVFQRRAPRPSAARGRAPRTVRRARASSMSTREDRERRLDQAHDAVGVATGAATLDDGAAVLQADQDRRARRASPAASSGEVLGERGQSEGARPALARTLVRHPPHDAMGLGESAAPLGHAPPGRRRRPWRRAVEAPRCSRRRRGARPSSHAPP